MQKLQNIFFSNLSEKKWPLDELQKKITVNYSTKKKCRNEEKYISKLSK